MVPVRWGWVPFYEKKGKGELEKGVGEWYSKERGEFLKEYLLN